MNNTVIPTPDTLPVHWGWFQILLTLTFVLHLLLMNLVLGGSLLAVGDLIRGKQIGRESRHIPTLIALTINLGVPPLLFVQVLFGNFFYSSSVMMSVYWILIIPVLILAYYGAYIFSIKMDSNSTFGKISMVTSTVLILYIAFMFVNNSTFSVQPGKWLAYRNHPGGTLLNVGDLSFWPRYLHFVIAAVAIAGLGKAVWAKFFDKKLEAGQKEEQIKKNLRIFAFATMIQFLTGIWFWLAMPGHVTMAFMGQNMLATILMAFVFTGALLIIMFALKGKLVPALITGVFQVVLMSVVREIVRYTYLSGIFSPSELENVHQTSPFIAFLFVFIIGLFLLFYMYKLAVEPKIKKS